jgi:hypothetical protein
LGQIQEPEQVALSGTEEKLTYNLREIQGIIANGIKDKILELVNYSK